MKRIARLSLLLALAAVSLPAARAARFDLHTATMADIQAAMDAGALTSEKLVRLYLARIEAYDKQGPRINSVITLNPQALETARALDAERREKGPRSPLHGVPVVLKDLFDTKDMPTTAGFLPMAKSQPPRDAFLVEKIRAAGGIVLAKVNLSDWFGVAKRGDQSTILGRTSNPYNLDLTPGGSSGGTGAAVAALFAQVGVGSETGVSIRNPLSNNNLVGIAATQGLISRTGQIMTSFTQERAGPYARNTYDMAVLLSIMRGFDAEDMVTAESLGKTPAEPYTEFLAPKDGLRGARIGVWRDLFRSGPTHVEGLALIEKAVADLKAAGAVVVDPIGTGLDMFTLLSTARTNVDEARFSYELYFSRLGPDAPIRSFAELLEKGGDLVKPNIRNVSAKIESLDREPTHTAKLKTRAVLRALAVELMDKYELDALVYPFKTEPAAPHMERAAESDNPFSSVTGLPALLVPAGFTNNNAPIAIEFLGRPWSEPTLVRLASAYEAASGHRKTPPTTPALPGEAFDYPASDS
ncbi:amidase family protein [Opitutales bacterium ASA1]|uniref:amidase family protein n=1 Tax=Congregicoccus parvus TaxID=3081749 RepID=UPI002B2E9D71|nr:amidase family protein [Opitutales bacterium ASA1]